MFSEAQDLLDALRNIPLFLEVTMITAIVGVITLIVGLAAICFYLNKLVEAIQRPNASPPIGPSNYPGGGYPGGVQYGQRPR